MMKLGMMIRQTEDSTIEEQMRFARQELILDAIDIHIGQMAREPGYLGSLKRLCLNSGLPIGYLGGGSLAGPEEKLPELIEQAKADVDAAALLGAQMVRVFARHRWPDTVEEQEALWAPMIRAFQQVADYAAAKGVIIGLQNHDNHSFAMTAKQVLCILRDSDRQNLTFIMDTGQWLGAIGSHPRGEFDPEVDLYADYLEPTAPYATCVRAKIYKIESGREEFLDYDRILRILKAVNFNGNISVVFEGGDFNRCSREECLRLAVRHLREIITKVYA